MPNDNSNGGTSRNTTRTEEALVETVAELTRGLNLSNSKVFVSEAAQHIPFYDGLNMPIKDFQDVENARSLLSNREEDQLLRSIISRLRGQARDALQGTTFNTINELKAHLKKTFSPPKSYHQYMAELLTLTMKRGESARCFYHRLLAQIEQAIVASGANDDAAKNSLKQHLGKLALQTFINGLPEMWRVTVAQSKPTTLLAALEAAELTEETCPSLAHQQRYVYRVLSPEEASRVTLQSDKNDTTAAAHQSELKKQVSFTDPLTNRRSSISYQYDERDTYFAPPEFDEYGRRNAHPNMSYSGNRGRPNTPSRRTPPPQRNEYPPHYYQPPQVPNQPYHYQSHHEPLQPPMYNQFQPPQQQYHQPQFQPYYNSYNYQPPPMPQPMYNYPTTYPPPLPYQGYQMPPQYPYPPNQPPPNNNTNNHQNRDSANSRPNSPKNVSETRRPDAAASPNANARPRSILTNPKERSTEREQ